MQLLVSLLKLQGRERGALAMRANGRQVTIYVNEIALQAWLNSSKPSPRPAVRAPESASAGEERRSEPKSQKAA